ncbi:GntR family transcriptional regulator [Serratia marcescens]|nr:GntR family transcriptional regulator [Serratia marcescens]
MAKQSTTIRQIESTADRAYQHLLQKVIVFDVPPGERINEVEVASTLEMSRAPVREALNRLLSESMVAFEPGKGFFCRKLSATEISQLFEVRADLECAAIRQLCLLSDHSKISRMRKKWIDIESNERSIDINSLVEMDEGFHLELVSLTGNSEKFKFLKIINSRIRFVRQINLEDLNRKSTSLAEHVVILDAILDRHESVAASLLDSHLKVTIEQAKRHISTGLSRIFASDIA